MNEDKTEKKETVKKNENGNERKLEGKEIREKAWNLRKRDMEKEWKAVESK